MTSIAYSPVNIQVCAQSSPALPCWFGEITLFAYRLTRQKISEEMADTVILVLMKGVEQLALTGKASDYNALMRGWSGWHLAQPYCLFSRIIYSLEQCTILMISACIAVVFLALVLLLVPVH